MSEWQLRVGMGMAATVVAALVVAVLLLLRRNRRLDNERRRAVDELAQASAAYKQANLRLANVNEGLEAFVRSASHDLKAPIRHIYGFCEFVHESAADRLTAEERGDLDRVMDAAKRLSNLLESLLRFAKLGDTALRDDTFSLTEVLDVVVEQLPSDRRASIQYGQLSSIRGDRELLTIVLQNLIENALRYVDAETSPEVRIECGSTDTGVEVAVIDNGIGVDQDRKEKIFEPGVRAVSETQYEGTGYGLAACARIIRAHGGKIWVESNPQQGSTFRFTVAGQPTKQAGNAALEA